MRVLADEKKAAADAAKDKDKFKVLEVFGIELHVSDPNLAKLLTTDASKAMTEDIRVLTGGVEDGEEPADQVREQVAKPAQAVAAPPPPPPVAAPAPPKEDTFGSRIDTIGRKLGFEVRAGGVWKSLTGIIILVRCIDRYVDLQQAGKYVAQLAEQQGRLSQQSAALFVVEDKVTVDIFKAAIRKSQLYNEMRVISYENLQEILSFRESERIGHRQVVTLLVPLDNIDVGELLNVMRAAATPLFNG
ncbi:MAG: hypothetical protein C4521_04990 [Actinobacteria bacterium]|nr:MAG: hypothetical protein C4521_04990 [Actinomycetota bacterium]